MVKFKAVVKTGYGELQVEADTVKELQSGLRELGIRFDIQKGSHATIRQAVVETATTGVEETVQKGRMPDDIVSKLPEMTYADVITAILLYEVKYATREQIIKRSKDLGKPIPIEWIKKNFYRDLRNLISVNHKEGQIAFYGLSDRGRLGAKKRMEELISSP